MNSRFVGLQVFGLSYVYWTPEFYILELFTLQGLTSCNNPLCELGRVLPGPVAVKGKGLMVRSKGLEQWTQR